MPEHRFCTRCGHRLGASAVAGTGPRAALPQGRGPRRRLLLLGTLAITIGAVLAVVATAHIGVWPLDGVSSGDRWFRRTASIGHLELEGRVERVESESRTVQLSSGILGFDTTTVSLSAETRILVGSKEGGVGDLRHGVRVRVLLDARLRPPLARVVEILVGGGGGPPPHALPEGLMSSEIPAATGPGPSSSPPPARGAASPAATTPSPAGTPRPGPPSTVATASRHAGTVVEVGSDHLVVVDLHLAGKAEQLRVIVTPAARIAESERNPRATGLEDQFTTTPTTLGNVRKGDYVVMDVRREGNALVAQSLVVTLRGGEQ